MISQKTFKKLLTKRNTCDILNELCLTDTTKNNLDN